MSAAKMTLTVLCSTLAEAVFRDEQPEEGGFDLSAGMFGRHVSAWLRETAGVIDAQAKQIERLTAWQPIETAPKDGTRILALFPELGQVVAYYTGDSVNSAAGWSIGQDYYGPGPTLWCPLVEKPNTTDDRPVRSI